MKNTMLNRLRFFLQWKYSKREKHLELYALSCASVLKQKGGYFPKIVNRMWRSLYFPLPYDAPFRTSIVVYTSGVQDIKGKIKLSL
jgi:hypothetical protein